MFFTDWQGDADERSPASPGSEVVEVLGRADERGVDVRGLIWRSHWEKLNFSASENRLLGRQLQARGAEALLDMRVRTGGSHHQKLVVIRYRDRPRATTSPTSAASTCATRGATTPSTSATRRPLEMAPEYGDTPPWHDVQAAITGPAVYDVETVFRERWEDPTPLTRHPVYWTQDRLLRMDMTPDPLPAQAPPPPPPEGGTHIVQLLRTYPNLRRGRDYPFARGGERSVARGYTKALARAGSLIYIEDQYLWGQHVGDVFTEALRRNPDLHVIAVVPLFTDQDGRPGPHPADARPRAGDAADDRRGARTGWRSTGSRTTQGTPVYVHAKVCVIDDIVGHHRLGQLQPPVVDPRLRAVGRRGRPARRRPQSLCPPAAADPRRRAPRPGGRRRLAARGDGGLRRRARHVRGVRTRRRAPSTTGTTAARSASGRRDACAGCSRPSPDCSSVPCVTVPYLCLHDPDGRPRRLGKLGGF